MIGLWTWIDQNPGPVMCVAVAVGLTIGGIVTTRAERERAARRARRQ